MSQRLQHGLSKRERQIMEAIYRRKEAAVEEVRGEMPDPPGYSAVRTTLNILVEKGFLSTRKAGRKYLYFPVIPHEKARLSALRQMLQTYFDNSVPAAVATLLKSSRKGLSEDDFLSLSRLIEEARKKE